MGEYWGEVGEFCMGEVGEARDPEVGVNCGLVGEYSGEVGLYCGDVGLPKAGLVGEFLCIIGPLWNAGLVGEYIGDVGL